MLESLAGLFEQYSPLSWVVAGFAVFLCYSVAVFIRGTWQLHSSMQRQQNEYAADMDGFRASGSEDSNIIPFIPAEDDTWDRLVDAIDDEYPPSAVIEVVVFDGPQEDPIK